MERGRGIHFIKVAQQQRNSLPSQQEYSECRKVERLVYHGKRRLIKDLVSHVQEVAMQKNTKDLFDTTMELPGKCR